LLKELDQCKNFDPLEKPTNAVPIDKNFEFTLEKKPNQDALAESMKPLG
jgi:hypothetical protein